MQLPKPIYLKALTRSLESVTQDFEAPGGPRRSRFERLP
jgi:hypothetical protein